MRNVTTSIVNGILTIAVDLGVTGEVSSSGKSLVIGSTEGNTLLDGTDITVGLNVYTKNPNPPAALPKAPATAIMQPKAPATKKPAKSVSNAQLAKLLSTLLAKAA